MALGGLLDDCSCGDEDPPPPGVTAEPSRSDIIEAVRESVDGKTYEATVTRWEDELRVCDQLDVDLDPYMPGNPERAKCPAAGATYWEPVPVQVTETQTCDALPGESSDWYVTDSGEDRWRVSLAGRSWDVERLAGGAAGSDAFTVSGFVMAVTAHQEC